MENAEFNPHASVLSKSALHAYITGPVNANPPAKSAFNPYRKRSGLLSLMNLKAVEEALEQAVGADAEELKPLALPESTLPLTGTPATT